MINSHFGALLNLPPGR